MTCRGTFVIESCKYFILCMFERLVKAFCRGCMIWLSYSSGMVKMVRFGCLSGKMIEIELEHDL